MERRRCIDEVRTWTGSGKDRINEDYAQVDADLRCAVLVDGATGLTKHNLMTDTTDASWYARRLVTATLEEVRAGGDPREALGRAGRSVADEYLRLQGTTVLRREDLPNASVAVLAWDDSTMRVIMLGDCTAVVGMRAGESHVIHDATLDALDQQNYERMYRYATEHGTSMKEARVAVNDKFIMNRLKMNEPGGYWAADVTCRGFGHETVVEFALRDVRYAFACSDGYAAAVSMGVVSSAQNMGDAVARGEGPELGELLRVAERQDSGCWRVHRSKISDDATYVLVRCQAQ